MNKTMEFKWCWRCQEKVPMLNSEEYKIAHKLFGEAMKNLKSARTKEQRFEPLLDYYEKITGIRETNPNAIMHHATSLFGPDCPDCLKPLRTKDARYCVECGFGKEDLIDHRTRPLIERRPELFKK